MCMCGYGKAGGRAWRVTMQWDIDRPASCVATHGLGLDIRRGPEDPSSERLPFHSAPTPHVYHQLIAFRPPSASVTAGRTPMEATRRLRESTTRDPPHVTHTSLHSLSKPNSGKFSNLQIILNSEQNTTLRVGHNVTRKVARQ